MANMTSHVMRLNWFNISWLIYHRNELINDLLNYNKRAVNRQLEIMGMRTGLMSGTDVEAMSKHRPAAPEFGRRVREEGLKAALEWRDGPFGDFRGEYSTAPKDRPIAGQEGKGEQGDADYSR